MERIIILGAGIMQGPAIRIAKELGFYTVAVDGSSAAPCIAMADQFEQIDLKDKEGIEAFARSLRDSGGRADGLGGIMTAGTDFSATVAWVAEKLGLPGIPYEAALNASDKARMRSCFKQAGIPSPEFIGVAQEEFLPRSTRSYTEDARACARNIERVFGDMRHGISPNKILHKNNATGRGSRTKTPWYSKLSNGQQTSVVNSSLLDTFSLSFPLVIKPVDNMGGRGCRRADTIEEFGEAAADAFRFSRSGRAIVEAFMDGPEFSVDAIVYHGEITICGLADRHIFFPPYFIEMGHTMPTNIAPAEQAALLETFCAGVRALGLAGEHSVGAAKGDIKLTPQGPMIGEIAARLSGGYMSGWTYPYSSGVEPIRAAVLAAMGRKPDNLAPQKTWTSAERAFISIPGTVKAISGTETARSLPHIRDLFFRIAAGDKVGFPQNNVSKCGNIISAAPDRLTAVEAAENAARSILIRLDPNDGETAAFLTAIDEGFPPDAFQLSAELRAALEKLPENGDWGLGTSSLFPFPAFTNSGLRDYVGRTVAESLQLVRELTGLSLPEIPVENLKSSDNIGSFLGKPFWAALVRGGFQGAVYYIDQWRGDH